MGIQFVKNICAFTVEKCLYCVMLPICESVSLFYMVAEKSAFAGEALAIWALVVFVRFFLSSWN